MVDLLFSFSLRFIGEVAALTAMVGMAVMFLTGALSDRYNRRYVVAGLIGLQLICAVMFLFSVDQFVGPLLVLATGSGLGSMALRILPYLPTPGANTGLVC